MSKLPPSLLTSCCDVLDKVKAAEGRAVTEVVVPGEDHEECLVCHQHFNKNVSR